MWFVVWWKSPRDDALTGYVLDAYPDEIESYARALSEGTESWSGPYRTQAEAQQVLQAVFDATVPTLQPGEAR